MNAVNLLPPDLRRGSGAPNRSGAGVYVALGALALVVVLVAVTTVMKGRVSDREADLVQAEAEAAAAEQQASAIAHYRDLAAQTGSRVESVRSVARGRVDWAGSLTEVGRTIGTKVVFSSLNATSSPSVGGGGGGGVAASGLRAAVTAPALEIVGCAENHPAVARLMARLRAMNDVKRVSLASTEREEPVGETNVAEAGSGGGDGSGCTTKLPAKFTIVIWLEGGPDANGTTAAATATATGTADASTGASGTSTTPAETSGATTAAPTTTTPGTATAPSTTSNASGVTE